MVVTELNVETLWGARLAHFYTGTILKCSPGFIVLHFCTLFTFSSLVLHANTAKFWQQISVNKYTLEKNSWHCCCSEQHLFLIRPGLEKGAKKFCLQSKHFLLFFFSSLCLFCEKHEILHFSPVHKVEIVHDRSQQRGPSTFFTGTTNRSIEF